MRLGIFGGAKDPQSLAMRAAFERLGHSTLLVEHDALDRGLPVSFDEGRTFYRGECVDDVHGYYLRFVPAPYAPVLSRNDRFELYEDWFVHYMQTRERASFFVSWLLQLQHRGVTLVNAPHAGSVLQYKPFQLHVLRSVGARVPQTLISNDPQRVREFHAAVGEVIFKPVMGGAETKLLDAAALKGLDKISAAPVIFQERVRGDDLRVMLVGDEVVSCVAIETPAQHLDFRADPAYGGGRAAYREVVLPEGVKDQCRKAARQCGLRLAGIDIKAHGDNYVFLELNSSPVYLDVELKLGHPITEKIARLVASGAERAATQA